MTHTPLVSRAGCGMSEDHNATTRYAHFQSPAPQSSRSKVNPYGHLYSLATNCPTTHRTRGWEDASPPWTPQSSSRSLPYISTSAPRITQVSRPQLYPPAMTNIPTPLAARSLYMSPRSRSPLAPENAQPATYADTGCVYQHVPCADLTVASTGLSPINALTSVAQPSHNVFHTQPHVVYPPPTFTRQRSSLGAVYSNYSGRGGRSESEVCPPMKLPTSEWRVSSPSKYISSVPSDLSQNAAATPRDLKSKYLMDHPEAAIVPAAASNVVKCPFRSLRVAIDDIEWSPSETGAVYALEMSHGCESGCVTLRHHSPNENVCNAQMALSPESNLRFEVRDFAGRSLGRCDLDIAKMILESTSALTGHLPIGQSLDSPRLRVRSSIELSLLQAPEHPPTEAASTDPISECGDTTRDMNMFLRVSSCLPEGEAAARVEKATFYIDGKEVAELSDLSASFTPVEFACTESSKLLTLELFSPDEHLGNAVLHLYPTLYTKSSCEETLNVFTPSGEVVPIGIHFKADIVRRQFDSVPEVLEEVDEEEEEELSNEEEDHVTSIEGDETEQKTDDATELSPDPLTRAKMGSVIEEIETYPAKSVMRRVLSEVETGRVRLSLKKIRSEIVQVPAKRAMKSVLTEIPQAKAKRAMKSVIADIPVARTKRHMRSLLESIPRGKTILKMKGLREEIERAPFRKAMSSVCHQLTAASLAMAKSTDSLPLGPATAHEHRQDQAHSADHTAAALQRARTMPVHPPTSAESVEGTDSLRSDHSSQQSQKSEEKAQATAEPPDITSTRVTQPQESRQSSSANPLAPAASLDASDALKRIINSIQEEISLRNAFSTHQDEQVRRAAKRRRTRKRKSNKRTGTPPTGDEWVIQITDENDRKQCLGANEDVKGI